MKIKSELRKTMPIPLYNINKNIENKVVIRRRLHCRSIKMRIFPSPDDIKQGAPLVCWLAATGRHSRHNLLQCYTVT